jgi:phospholipid/cholesterol/gamma-HCH transport system substrate-binding protein
LANNDAALVDAVNTVGQTAATLASRRRQLAATIGDAPATLTNLDGFLAKLQNLTVPLAPAARDITATAPELDAALAQVGPFTSAADPDLTEATSDAPELTDLATGATPVLKTATPVVENLASLSQDLQPVSDTLSKSVDNLLAILQNWSRAIQFRDGLSHVFRGEASASPYTVTSLINQLEANPVVGSALAKLEQSLRLGKKVSSKSSAGNRLSASGLSSVLGGLLHAPSKSAGSGSQRTVTTSTTPSSTAASTTTTTTGATGVGAGLSSLLNYLLK